MSNSIVATVYSGVMKDVIENVKNDFIENGVNLSVLGELEKLWEQKIKNAKVATWEANALSGDDHNQNINGGPSNYMQQQPPMQQPMQPPMQPIQQSDPNLKFQQTRDLQAAASLPSLAVNNNMHTTHNNEGRPQPYIKNGNIGNIQLTAQPSTSSFPTSSDISNNTPINNPIDDQKIYHQQHHPNLHTMMGQQDEYGNPLGEKLIPRGENSTNSSPLPEFTTRSEPSLVDNDDINSELDDSDDEETNAEGEDTQNIILCLYDKVTRTKNKWKCQLKDGIMSVNGRDYLFQKGNGDFEF